MSYHIPSDPSAPSQESWSVIHKYGDGLNVILYPNEEMAERAAVKMIVSKDYMNYIIDMEPEILNFVRQQNWKRVIEAFNFLFANDDESFTIEKLDFCAYVDIPTVEDDSIFETEKE